MPVFSSLRHYPWLHTAAGRLTPEQHAWLFRPGALTAGLRGLGQFKLRVTREFAGGLPRMNTTTLGRTHGTPVWIREVVMSIDGIDCVAARSMTPLQASHGAWSAIRRLNTRPLADILYGTREVRRGPFSWRQLGVGDPLWLTVRKHVLEVSGDIQPKLPTTLASAPALYARQSVFWRKDEPLLVQECFLPDFWQLR